MLRVDAETMEAIEKWAADEFRSTNGQLQWIIAEALRKSGRMKKKKTIIKKDLVEQFADACEKAGVSQAGQISEMMKAFIEEQNK